MSGNGGGNEDFDIRAKVFQSEDDETNIVATYSLEYLPLEYIII